MGNTRSNEYSRIKITCLKLPHNILLEFEDVYPTKINTIHRWRIEGRYNTPRDGVRSDTTIPSPRESSIDISLSHRSDSPRAQYSGMKKSTSDDVRLGGRPNSNKTVTLYHNDIAYNVIVLFIYRGSHYAYAENGSFPRFFVRLGRPYDQISLDKFELYRDD